VYDLIPLPMLARGQSAEVDHLVGHPDQIQRLQELGLRRGMWIEMVQPGVTCIVRVHESRLCFRDGEASRVLVRPAHVA